jgi:hypothetical protein
MSEPNSAPDAALRLKTLLKGAGLRSFRLDATHRGINFSGRSREWLVAARLTPDWLNLAITVCTLPELTSARDRLLAWAMGRNRSIALLKFAVYENLLLLEADYRAEHLDADVLGNIIGLLNSTAEEQYPAIFRITNGDDVLEKLERAMSQEEAA